MSNMEAVQIREKLHQFIDAIEDKKVEAMYMLFENDIDADAARKKIVQLERTKFLNGEGKSFTPAHVKEMALNKTLRSEL